MYKETRVFFGEGGWWWWWWWWYGTEEIDPSATTLPERGRKGRRREGGETTWWFFHQSSDSFVTVNLVKFIFFAASVFYKGSFNLFLLCPVGDPRSFFFLHLPPLCSTLFSLPLRPSLFLPSVFFLSPCLSSSCGSECFNNDTLGIWDGRAAFFSCKESSPSPRPPSLSLLLSLLPFFNPSLL